jgi:hypothetical protein
MSEEETTYIKRRSRKSGGHTIASVITSQETGFCSIIRNNYLMQFRE